MKFEQKVLGKVYTFDDEYVNSLICRDVEVKRVYDVEEIRDYLKKSDRFVINSLIKMYMMQTAEEQEGKSTEYKNGVGFNAFDANVLSNIARQCINEHYITVKQVNLVYNKIKKYAKQITQIANGNIKMVEKARKFDCKFIHYDSNCNGYCSNENCEHYRHIVCDDNNNTCLEECHNYLI